ncbi:hypothetical protein M9H77_24884 [Catharanthus roseus]|uniref:Uncharacterized protein n=1 Tax=Catharanthus roseus TaxID=4058 RepID=A0ACC0A677_CATRO|nr:hypothetical protein M9H77_24884 [Catharanthus roseus]
MKEETEFIQVLHMNGGEGDTSYAKNSLVQRKIISFEDSVIEEAVADIICNHFPESMGIADLGCSSGPNTLMLAHEVIDKVYDICRRIGKPLPELRVCLNDLHVNDFNNVFMSLPEFHGKLEEEKGKGFFNHCFISAVPGSFYGRLFPSKSMHFLHSSSSLHWLSQVPSPLDTEASAHLNKGKLYLSKTSSPNIIKAYRSQFQKDFSVFLKSRSEEMVSGGRMVLSFLGRSSSDTSVEDGCYQWELLAQALTSMVSKGQVTEEKIDSFNAPYYAPSAEEVKTAVEEEGSFAINYFKAIEIEWDVGFQNDSEKQDEDEMRRTSRGQKVAKTIRAVVESMLEGHFGKDIDMDALFVKYAELADDYFNSKGRPIYINFVMSFTRKIEDKQV